MNHVLTFIQKNNLNVSRTEKEAGIPKGRMAKWLAGKGAPKVEDSEKLQKWYDLHYGEEVPKLEEVQKDAPVSDFKANTGAGVSEASIHGLIRTNEKLAAAALGDVENRKLLIRQNEELLSMVKQSGNVQPGNHEAFQSKFLAALEFLAEVAAGKRYKSVDEASAALSKTVFDGPAQKKGRGIRRD